jgi:signal transduction histidine kinase
MEIRKKNAISIFRLFLEHLIGLSIAIISLIIAMTIIVSLSFQSGFILQANYTDVKLKELENNLSKNFDKNVLPSYCSYILIDDAGDLIESNMSKKDIEKTRSFLLSSKKSYYDFYKEIPQPDHNILIIKYDMLAHFNNPLLHKVIPYPELIFLLIFLVFIILFFIITALKFSRKLKQNLTPIITATEKIEAQDLDFKIEPTRILEFNSSLDAIDKLKEALTVLLNKQWDNEQQRKSQLSALAHDIKTPLTIIKGNAELLLEEECSKENKELISYIQTSSNTIEKYLELLMGVVNNESLSFNRELIRLNNFMNDVTADALPLCKIKNIELNLQTFAKCHSIYIDKDLFKRAIINIIDNAVRYSYKNSHIDVVVSDNETHIIFEINDYGKGFSEEGLKKATQEIFKEETTLANHNYVL